VILTNRGFQLPQLSSQSAVVPRAPPLLVAAFVFVFFAVDTHLVLDLHTRRQETPHSDIVGVSELAPEVGADHPLHILRPLSRALRAPVLVVYPSSTGA
jgi:hypothetical protein